MAAALLLLLPIAFSFGIDPLRSAMLYENSTFPDHEFVKKYNLNITVSEAPENTTIHQSTYLKNVWLSFLTVYPSVIENNTLYVTSETNTLCASNYSVILPSNYNSPRWPIKSQGDCKRTYTLTSDSSNIAILEESNLITARLQANANVKIEHYKWNSWCCRRKFGSCLRWCHDCIFSYTQNDPDQVIPAKTSIITPTTVAAYLTKL